MRINHNLIFLLVSFTLLSSRCRRHCDSSIPQKILIPQEVLDYVDFKTGSYWISRDSATGNIDSIVVTSSKHIKEGVTTVKNCGEEVYDPEYENIVNETRRFRSGSVIAAWAITFENGPKMHGTSPRDEFIITSLGPLSIGYPFDRIYHFNKCTITQSKADSLITNGGTYYNVLNVKILEDADSTSYNIFSYAKGIGMIQVISVSNSKQIIKNYVIRYTIK